MQLLKRVREIIDTPGRVYINRIAAADARRRRPRATNERTVEYGFALRCFARHRPTSVIDVGTGKTSWPHLLYGCGYLVTAIDNVRDYWPRGMVNRHWPIHDVDVTNPAQNLGPVDAITCISVLEHIPAHERAMATMARWLRPGGLLVLTCPFAATYDPNVYVRPDATMRGNHSYVCQSYSPAQLERWLNLGFALDAAEYWHMFTGPVWRTGSADIWRQVAHPSEGQLGCFALVRK